MVFSPLEAKLALVSRVDGLAGDKVTEQTQVDVSWSAEAPAFRQIVQMMGAYDPKLKGSIGEGSNHSNFSHQSAVKILSKFNAFC